MKMPGKKGLFGNRKGGKKVHQEWADELKLWQEGVKMNSTVGEDETVKVKSWWNLLDRLSVFGGFLSGVFILIMGFIITYEVIMRYIFRAPTSWVLEISIYLSLASVFLAGGNAMRENKHIQVDSVTSRLSSRDQALYQLICLVLSLIYCVVFTWKGAEIAISSLLMGEVSPTVLNTPMVIPHSLMPIGGALLSLEIIRMIVMELSKLRNAGRPEGKSWFIGNLPVLIFLSLIALCAPMFLSKDLVPIGFTLLIFVLLFGGMPIAFALGMLGLMGLQFAFGGGPLLAQVPISIYKMLDDFITTAVPMFLMLSVILSVGEIGSKLFDFASKWVRHLPGGLGVATILACGIFAAMCGSAVATVATIGIIAIPEMLARNYDRKLVYGTVAIGGVLGPLIPPSLFMILIGTMTGDSVGKLFMSGTVPGIMLVVFFSGYIILKSKFGREANRSRIEPASWKERLGVLKTSFFGIMAPVIILGGIYTGIFTPTEAAAVGIVYSLIVCALFYRSITFKKMRLIIMEGGTLASGILFMVAGAMVFGQVVTMLQIPERVCGFLAALPLAPMTILWITLALILVLGALMDEAGILLITYPTLYYVFCTHFGFDSIWFALVFVFTLEVGLVAPPVAINIFVVQGIWKEAKYGEVVKGVLPFVFIMIAAILLVVYVRPLSTWLPGLIG
jgi:C4-dicarboxylate transporter, DctM subunit